MLGVAFKSQYYDGDDQPNSSTQFKGELQYLLKCLLKTQKCSGAVMMIEWTGGLTLMSLSLLNMYLKPGKSIRMVYMFNCSNVCYLVSFVIICSFFLFWCLVSTSGAWHVNKNKQTIKSIFGVAAT